jgi:uncharacterized membrane protein (UPF0127 family)
VPHALGRVAAVVVVAGLSAGLSGCSHAQAPRRATEPEVVLSPGGAAPSEVAVEVARTPQELQRGLMFRDHLEAGRGMLFLFPRSQPLRFWMHNTYIPLDMIFISAARSVVGVVENAQPLTDDPRYVDGDSQFVLEVPGGWAAVHRIAPGTPVRFVGVD